MGDRFDLHIELNYRLRTGYNKLLKPREWVRGMPVEIGAKVTNKSAQAFPGTTLGMSLVEHGQSMGVSSLSWSTTSKLQIPPLRPGDSTILEHLIGFVPLVEGLCEIRLNVEEPAKLEVWVTGWRQSEPRRREIRGFFSVVRWQEMEMISLLRKLGKGGSNG